MEQEKDLATKAIEAIEKIGEDVAETRAAVSDLDGKVKAVDEKVESVKSEVDDVRKTIAQVETRDKHERNVIDLVGEVAFRRAEELFRKLPRELVDDTAQYLRASLLSRCVGKLGSHGVARMRELMDKIDERAAERWGQAWRVKADLQEDTSSEGGYTVPTAFEAVVLRLAEDASIVRSLSTVVPMTTKTHQVPALDTAPTAYIVPEETDMSSSAEAWSSGPFSQKNLTAKKLGTYTEVSGELAQDNAILLMQFLSIVFGEAVGLLEDAQALEGDGTGNNFTGLIAASGVNAVTQTAGAPSYAKLVETVFKASKRSSRRGAAWIMHPKVAQQVAAMVDSNGQPIFHWTNSELSSGLVGPGAGEGRLLGYPVFTSEQIATNNGTGTNEAYIYFGPFGGFHMVFGDLLGFEVAASEQFKFSTFQIAVRGLKRTAILVGVPSAFTIYKNVTVS